MWGSPHCIRTDAEAAHALQRCGPYICDPDHHTQGVVAGPQWLGIGRSGIGFERHLQSRTGWWQLGLHDGGDQAQHEHQVDDEEEGGETNGVSWLAASGDPHDVNLCMKLYGAVQLICWV